MVSPFKWFREKANEALEVSIGTASARTFDRDLGALPSVKKSIDQLKNFSYGMASTRIFDGDKFPGGLVH